MRLVKVNDTDYVNPEKIIRISHEKFKTDDEKESWCIYTVEGKIKTDPDFNVKAFIRKSR